MKHGGRLAALGGALRRPQSARGHP